MDRFTIYTIIASVLLAATGCAADGRDSVEPAQPAPLVAEGWIDSDGTPTVLLSHAISLDSDSHTTADMLAYFCVVEISDGLQTVTLYGSYDAAYTPPYVYRTGMMTGRPGRTYTLTATDGHSHIASSCVMPQAVEIKRVEFEPDGDEGDKRRCHVFFDAPADLPAYFQLFARADESESRLYPSVMGAIEVTGPGEVCLSATKRQQLGQNKEDYENLYLPGEKVTLMLRRCTKEVYDFWYDYQSMTLFGQNQFITAPKSLPTNITGGYGIWGAYGCSVRKVTVPF